MIGTEELAQVNEVFTGGGVLCRGGFEDRRGSFKVREFEAAFSSAMEVPHALAVSSGTAALRVSLAALGIGPGDEVITQSFTFVATVEAIIESGAVPVCAEIDETLNLDPVDLQRRITPRTRAVIAVHMLGTPARLQELVEICSARDIALVEDTAWGCGGTLSGRPLGTIGRMGTYSFDYAKTITTGEGGMVVFEDELLWQSATAWHDHGHENNPSLPRWEDTRAGSGFNFRMTELQAAVGLAQLRKLPTVVAAQVENRDRLWSAVEDLPGLEPRAVPDSAEETADALVFFVPDHDLAVRCRESLGKRGLSTKILPEALSWHFAGTWTHMPSLVDSHGGNVSDAFPRSKQLLERAVSLPVTVRMADEVPAQVRDSLAEVLRR